MRSCKNCGESIEGMNSRAKFCSSSCRSEHWRYGESDPNENSARKKSKLVPKSRSVNNEQSKHVPGLKGVIKEQEEDLINPEYEKVENQIKKVSHNLVQTKHSCQTIKKRFKSSAQVWKF